MRTQSSLSRVNADKFFPCQQIAARSRNGAIDALESRDTGAIVYRYLNNRYQQRAFRRNAIIGAFVPVLGWPYTGVNTANALRCRDSKRACKQELQHSLPGPLLAKLRRQRHGYGDYIALLQNNHIDTTEVERLRETHGRSKSQPPADNAMPAAHRTWS